MSCIGDTCGTGDWNGPQPGDPSNDSVLSATPTFGGINVSWSYPGLNPHAVAHTILYRGTTDDFTAAYNYRICAGDFYFDPCDPDVLYYYWIRFVSINGTEGEPIGPAWATARPTISDMIEMLTGKIDMGVLANALKTEIARIQPIDARITQEIINRINENDVIGVTMSGIQLDVDTTAAFALSEATARTEGDAVLAHSINELFVSTDGNAALILEEATTRADADSALASQITTTAATINNNITSAITTERSVRVSAEAAIVNSVDLLSANIAPTIAASILAERTIRVAAENVIAGTVTTLATSVAGNASSISAEATARSTADAAIVSTANALATQVGLNTAGLVNEVTARSDADTAMAGDITLLYSRTASNLAAIQSEATTRTNADSAMATNISTLFTTTSNSSAAISAEVTARSNADSALTTQINTQYVTLTGDIAAAVQVETNARVAADSAIATSVNTVQSTLNSNIASAQTTLQTNINTEAGRITSIGALYTAKVSVNGLVGGFGVYNDGSTIQAGFDVDEFWVGKTQANKRKPFIISGGYVYIDKAAIAELEVEKINSGNVNAEWRMSGANGRIVMDNGTTMKVIGTGFGASNNLIEWFGPSMSISACTKANAVAYLSTDGSAYYGGTLRAGVLYNARQTTETAADASVPVGPFFSNGNPRSVVVSYTFERRQQYLPGNSTGFSYTSGSSTATVEVYKKFNSGGEVFVTSFNITGSYNIINEPDGPDYADTMMSGSLTFTDTGASGDYTYIARMTARTLVIITHASSGSTTPTFKQTLGVVSIEN